MASPYSLANPIYQHSGETKKVAPIAAQASINEDIEKRRRLLDLNGEARKIVLAKQVSTIVDDTTTIHLHPAPYPVFEVETSLLQAGADSISHAAATARDVAVEAASTVTTAASNASAAAIDAAAGVAAKTSAVAHNAADATINAAAGVAATTSAVAHNAADAAIDAVAGVAATTSAVAHNAADTVTNAAYAAADTAQHLGEEAAIKLSHAKQDAASLWSRAAGFVSNATKNAANAIGHATAEAAHAASDAAVIVGHKTMEFAEGAAHKAHQVADNISHFTALVTVLAAEEKERTRRLTDGEETNAVLNAFRVADLIKALGPAFYRQAPANHSYSTKLLEEIERRWRLNSSYSAVGEKNAHSIGKLVSSNMHDFEHFIPRHQQIRAHIRNTEEKERTRRLNDTDETYAIMNAMTLSGFIAELEWPFYRQSDLSKQHRAFATTLLEETERRWRIRSDKFTHAEDSAHHLKDVFNTSSKGTASLVNEFATKLGNATVQVVQQFNDKTREFALSTVSRAQGLAEDLSTFTARMYVLALEEGERKRRLIDSDESQAILNAWAQSALIRDCWALNRQANRTVVFPTRYLALLEQRRRIASGEDLHAKKNANKIAGIVEANLSKFELAHEYAAELMRKREVAKQSRLNPNAPAFVPSSQLLAKVEPVIVRSNLAAGAQL